MFICTKASELIEILENGVKDLKERPEYFKQFNASNGWGMYENGIPRISRGGRIKDGEKQE